MPNKRWIALNGQYPELVIKCLETSFPVWDEHGNKSKINSALVEMMFLFYFLICTYCTLALIIAVSPHQARLGTSYSSLKENGNVTRRDLKLNKEALINAVRGLTNAYLDIDESIRVPEFVLTLIQMIPEAVRIEPMLSFISKHYIHNNLTTRNLPASLIKMQGSWTRVSRAIALTTYGLPFKKIRLKTGHTLRDVEEAMAMYPYTRGVKLDELDLD